MKHFYSSIFFTFLGFIITYFYLGKFEALYVVFLLAILEVTLSFDNAVVNAKVLETMEPKWQKRFITYGIPIAVFGMRLVFPIVIVAVAGGLGIIETFNMSISNPEKYKETLDRVDEYIYAFGGAFLFMVFLDFLFDEERKISWIKWIECNSFVQRVAYEDNTEHIIATLIGLGLIYHTHSVGIALAYFTGTLLHSLLITLDGLLSTNGVRSGIMGLVYLEVLDASFSFDGVIGAFALSSNLFIIMIGLGIGAMFVRSLTLYLVEMKTLDEYKYLEHGAHYAIVVLAGIMFAKIIWNETHFSEVFVGTVGIAFVGASVGYSIYMRGKNEDEEEQCQ